MICLIYVCSWVRELTLLFSHLQRQRNTKKVLHNYHTLLSGLRPYSSLYVSGDRYASVQLQNTHHICHLILNTQHSLPIHAHIHSAVIFTNLFTHNAKKKVTKYTEMLLHSTSEELQMLHMCYHCSVLFPVNGLTYYSHY